MSTSYQEMVARERYQRSLRRAQIQDLLGMITGTETDLVNFDDVVHRLRARQEGRREIAEVSLNKIVGSVGRYHDFTRQFLPRSRVSSERWARLDAALNSLANIPPVELYKIGDVYFVRDGNHRISVARANRLKTIEAYVTELESPVPLTLSDFERDRWIIKTEYADFLDRTRLDILRPGADLLLTAPGRYGTILEHIDVHGYFQNQEMARQNRDERLSYEDQVMSWYDSVYIPVVEAVRRFDLLREFRSRTEADLYLWISEHREALALNYGLAPLSPDAAVATFAESHSENPINRTLKGIRQGLQRTLGTSIPPGMSESEFQQARARHQAGERSILEAKIESEEEKD